MANGAASRRAAVASATVHSTWDSIQPQALALRFPYEKGQQATQEDYLKAQELIAARGQPDATAEPKDLTPTEPEPGTPEAKSAERKAIARAKQSLADMGAVNEAAA